MTARPDDVESSLPGSLSFARPKGEQLQEFLEEFVTSLAPGAMLPSERALAERYGVARMTVRHELDRLVSKGLIYKVHGRGTFVAEPKFMQSQSLTSFSEEMRVRGMIPGSRLLSQGIVPAHETVARELEIAVRAPVIRIERVRTADGEPMAYERAHLPATRFAGLERADLGEVSLYALLERDWGIKLSSARQRVAAVALSKSEADRLEVPAGRPAFLMERTTRDTSGVAVEYVRSLYRGDRYEVDTHLERVPPA